MEKVNKYKCEVPPGLDEVEADAETGDVPVFAEQGKPRGRKPARDTHGGPRKAAPKKSKNTSGKKTKSTKKGGAAKKTKTKKATRKTKKTRAQGSGSKDQPSSGAVSKKRKVPRRKRESSEPVGTTPPHT